MISTLAKSCLILAVMALLATASWVHAAVETSLQKTLQIEAVPIDVSVSPDGRSTFVLTDQGNVVEDSMFISFLFDQTGRFLASCLRSYETSTVWDRRAG
jgi:hypothetical protein